MEKSGKRCEIILYVQVVVLVIKVAEEEKKSTPTEAVMPPSAAAPFLAWPPLLLHPWAPALLPGAWCSSAAAIRSALPGLVKIFMIYWVFVDAPTNFVVLTIWGFSGSKISVIARLNFLLR